MSSTIMNTYGRLKVSFNQGEGVWLYDADDRRYLDAISGIGVNALGHNHPAITEAIQKQAGLLLHTSNLYNIPNQQQLADKLTNESGMSRCFFSNSGAEANEAAIKIARLHGANQGIEKPTIVTFTGAFHGRTLATLTATGNEKIKKGFGPFIEGFIQVNFNDLDAVKALQDNPDIVAILVEPIQGEGGVNIANPDFLTGLRKLCDNNNWLMMLDEVQTGNGRTGKYFNYQHFDWQPDVVTTAKGLGNGVPIGACLAKGSAAELFQPGHHGSTYGGNPLACAAANAVVTTLTEHGVIDNAAKMGAYLLTELQAQLKDNPRVKSIRGYGLMLGIELTQPCTELVQLALAQGILINVTAGHVIRLLPPLIINQQDAELLTNTVVGLINTREKA